MANNATNVIHTEITNLKTIVNKHLSLTKDECEGIYNSTCNDLEDDNAVGSTIHIHESVMKRIVVHNNPNGEMTTHVIEQFTDEDLKWALSRSPKIF